MDEPEAPVVPDKPEAPAVDYEAQYNELRPKFTQVSQEAAELRRWQEQINTDEDAQRELLAQLGYEVEEPEPVVYDDPTQALAAQLAAMDARLQAREQRDEQQTEAQQNAKRIAEIEADRDAKFTSLKVPDEVRPFVEDYALMRLAPLDDNTLDIKGAYEALSGLITPKPGAAPRPPHFVANGVQGDYKPNLDDPSERRAHMAAQLAALESGG